MGTARNAYLADFIPTHGSKQTHKSPSSVVVGVSTNENPLCDMRSRMKSAFGAIIERPYNRERTVEFLKGDWQ